MVHIVEVFVKSLDEYVGDLSHPLGEFRHPVLDDDEMRGARPRLKLQHEKPTIPSDSAFRPRTAAS